ncbi:2-amino-4-hydroxy-6-hydroxymethyldihydropteridine diphosphokinase [Psychrobacter sp. NZS113]|uniref:2-amino-4-hydroxy-6- hydroxymethyldihydropteridine diphosphokinase n=1 Tax=Psychrobacter sp. NZS113 TaxID=2792045 RepID=UPI0018CC9349|nr:2-amino-4-hydroxy-6-hydroxymethyldihydropteridine diphosphokinase [Psychrobacter sp. NZS113]MBH0095002.1 2-amino-4-hydroxy-6-hydroxymethyldihydropteridine diphosphokinase [Psychrobacter sp. NZS113]
MPNMDNNTDNISWVTCYVGLGSNLANELGSPAEHLQQAVAIMREHEQIREIQVSSFYASAPMGPQDQSDFVNAVVGFETTLPALELLAFCQQLESQAMRARIRHWGERSLDVDILLYGDVHITEPQLSVPHVGLTERNFVLIPLRELSPNLIITGMAISDYPQSKDWTGLKLLSSGD